MVVSDLERGLISSVKAMVKFQVNDEAIDFLSLHCDGDARVALNALENLSHKRSFKIQRIFCHCDHI